MKTVLKVSALVLGILGSALAGGVNTTSPRPTLRTHTYTCTGGQQVRVNYVSTPTGTNFVEVRYKGQTYGLAEATSASGSRYVGLTAPQNAGGLEWWEHQGEGHLSRFTTDASNTTPLLTCKLR